jgi:hypothetical protein
MIAYAFRFTDDDGIPTNWYGIAFAQDKRELFFQIDMHGDPYRCQIKTLQRGSATFLINELEDTMDIVETDIDMDFMDDDNPWKTPKWKAPRYG